MFTSVKAILASVSFLLGYALYCLVFVCASSINLCAQQGGDMLQQWKQSFMGEKKLNFRIDSRNSFINHRTTKVTGIKLGYIFDQKLNIGLSYNWINSPLYNSAWKGGKLEYNRLYLHYWAPYMEYHYFKNQSIRLTVLMQLGFGQSYLKCIDCNSNKKSQNTFMLIYEPHSSIDFKIGKGVDLGLGIGYRLLPFAWNRFGFNWNSPIYILRVKTVPSEIIHAIMASS